MAAPPFNADHGTSEKDDVTCEPDDFREEISKDEHKKSSIDPLSVTSIPRPKDFHFELTCVICCKDSGPPSHFCCEGHVTCESCYWEEPGENASCRAELLKGLLCGARMEEIDQSIKNTPYFKRYMDIIRFKCFGRIYGCDFVGNGHQLAQHEMAECKFRPLRLCGFQGEKCSAVFSNIEAHVNHLHEVHGLPWTSHREGNFFIKYDRKEYIEVGGKLQHNVVPNIRALIHGGRKFNWFFCALIAKDIQEEGKKFTRVMIVTCRKPAKQYRLEAQITVFSPPKTMANGKLGEAIAIHKTLAVLPDVQSIVREQLPRTCYHDFKYDHLDQVKIEKDGEKYFNLAVVVSVLNKETGVEEEVELLDKQSELDALFCELNEVEGKLLEIKNRPYSFMGDDDDSNEEDKLTETRKLRARREELNIQISFIYGNKGFYNEDMKELYNTSPPQHTYYEADVREYWDEE